MAPSLCWQYFGDQVLFHDLDRVLIIVDDSMVRRQEVFPGVGHLHLVLEFVERRPRLGRGLGRRRGPAPGIPRVQRLAIERACGRPRHGLSVQRLGLLGHTLDVGVQARECYRERRTLEGNALLGSVDLALEAVIAVEQHLGA